ncbi:hypothetical protein HAX54_004240 [Datura stramonium]|uniref:Ubiquitin conjugation factor E4 core domain-containing protein n=1 Tax=Datura stramonium TaxID=4076 RepID=A0ABS8T8Z1_DATST|nr:hypothetical protein [Datura stramonium]
MTRRRILLNLLNFLINDSIYLLDESLNKILELKELEAEMSNTEEWEQSPAQERQERTRCSIHKRIKVKLCFSYDGETGNIIRQRCGGPVGWPAGGYRLAKESEEYLASHGLKNAMYSMDFSDVRDDLFGTLIPCPFLIRPAIFLISAFSRLLGGTAGWTAGGPASWPAGGSG